MSPAERMVWDDRKRELRRGMQSRLEWQSQEAAKAASREVCALLMDADPIARAGIVGLYASVQWEIDVMPLVEDTRGMERAFVMPRWNSETTNYEFALFESLDQLRAGRFGIAEPSSAAPRADFGARDVVLVPGLAFSPSGARLGRGGGYYDRLLGDCSAVKIGVCLDCQLIDGVPRDVWDQTMDFIATPTQWINAGQN